jgi:hypothetical protein
MPLAEIRPVASTVRKESTPGKCRQPPPERGIDIDGCSVRRENPETVATQTYKGSPSCHAIDESCRCCLSLLWPVRSSLARRWYGVLGRNRRPLIQPRYCSGASRPWSAVLTFWRKARCLQSCHTHRLRRCRPGKTASQKAGSRINSTARHTTSCRLTQMA